MNEVIVFALTYRWWIVAIVAGWWIFKKGHETGFDPKMQTTDMVRVWLVWGNRVAIFGATIFVLVVVIAALANWAIPKVYRGILTSPITQTNDQMAADAIKVVGNLFSSDGTTVVSAGANPLTELVAQPAAPAAGPVVADLTSVLSSISSDVSAAVAPAMPAPTPASASGDFKVVAPAAQNIPVQPAVETAPVARPQQGPANLTGAWDNVVKAGTQSVWGNAQPIAPVVAPAPVVAIPVAPAFVGPQAAPSGWVQEGQQGPPVVPAQTWDRVGEDLSQQLFGAEKKDGGGGPTVHIVTSGDTMFKLAQRYGVTLSALCDLNLAVVRGNCSRLRSGMELMIPVN